MALPRELVQTISQCCSTRVIARGPTALIQNWLRQPELHVNELAEKFHSPYLNTYENALKLLAWAAASFPAAQNYLIYGITLLNAIQHRDIVTFQVARAFGQDNDHVLPLLLWQRAHSMKVVNDMLRIYLREPFQFHAAIFLASLLAGDFTFDCELLQLFFEFSLPSDLRIILLGAAHALCFPYRVEKTDAALFTAHNLSAYLQGYIRSGGNDVTKLAQFFPDLTTDLQRADIMMVLTFAQEPSNYSISERVALEEFLCIEDHDETARNFPDVLDFNSCLLTPRQLQERAAALLPRLARRYIASPARQSYQDLLNFILNPTSTPATVLPDYILLVFGRFDLAKTTLLHYQYGMMRNLILRTTDLPGLVKCLWNNSAALSHVQQILSSAACRGCLFPVAAILMPWLMDFSHLTAVFMKPTETLHDTLEYLRAQMKYSNMSFCYNNFLLHSLLPELQFENYEAELNLPGGSLFLRYHGHVIRTIVHSDHDRAFWSQHFTLVHLNAWQRLRRYAGSFF